MDALSVLIGLIEKAQALCFTACLSQNWWEFCVEYMVHIYNRTPMCCHNWQTPFEVLKRDKPNVSHLRVMDCGAYVFILEEVQVDKLAPRAELKTFLGYTNRTKGFCFMQGPNNVIFQATTALFDEHMFPHCLNTMD